MSKADKIFINTNKDLKIYCYSGIKGLNLSCWFLRLMSAICCYYSAEEIENYGNSEYIGLTGIEIYDNNDENGEHPEDVLQEYIEKGSSYEGPFVCLKILSLLILKFSIIDDGKYSSEKFFNL